MSNRMRSCLVTGGAIFGAVACSAIAAIYLFLINPSFQLFGLPNVILLLGIVVGSVVALLGLVFVDAVLGDLRGSRIKKTGKQATARVLKVEDSEFMSRNSGKVVVKLTLLVQPEGEPEFETVLEPTFSVLRLPQVGMLYNVRYDPSSHHVELARE